MSQPRRSSDNIPEENNGDFIIRKNIMPVWQLVILFAVCFSVLFFVATNPQMLGGTIGQGLAIFAIIGPLTWFTIYFSQQNRDMLLAAEFQNALFTAATRIKSRFVMIVKQDGTIFYFDRGFQKLFPETSSRGTLGIDKLFNTQQITPAEAEKLYYALESGEQQTVFIHLPNEDGSMQKVIITIDPLQRPAGFFILRGRDYVVKRYDRSSSEKALPAAANPHLAAGVTHLLHALPHGLYTTDAQGNILFINYRLESWLGYAQGEAAGKKLSLIDIMPQQNTPTTTQLLQQDCEGEVLFRSVEGRNVPLQLRQEITRDESGNIIGSVVILQQSAAAPVSAPAAAFSPASPAPVSPTLQSDEAPVASPSLIEGKKF